MNETIIVDNKQLGEMLGITESSVRKIISRGILEESLNNKGYKLIRRFKQGRKYVCEIEKADSCMEILYGVAKGMFNTDMIKEWGDYMLYRNANEDLPLSKNTLSELCNIHRNTITKWDKKMIENNFKSNDGKINNDNEILNSIIKNISQNSDKEYRIDYINCNYAINNNYNSITTNSGVYFILNKSNNLIKIGCTNNIQKRFKQIKGQFRHLGLDDNIELVKYIETDNYKQLEKELHKKYKDRRVNHEWFNISVDDID